MNVTIEDIDKAILSGLLAYKEVASTVIDELKEENSRLKEIININEKNIENANKAINELVASVEALEKDSIILKEGIDKAEKERTLCYACNKKFGDLASFKP